MIDPDKRYRVFNRTNYDIGVKLPNGIESNIPKGSFQIFTAYDIMYIESICTYIKFFATKRLEAVDDNNKPVPFENIGLTAEAADNMHYTKDEIENILKGSVKKIEAWLDTITEPSEIDNIYETVKNMELPASKLKILSVKIPQKDWLQ